MNIITALVDLLERVPAKHRARIYQWAATLAAVLTVLVLLAANAPLLFGVEVPPRPVAILTAWTTLIAALAKVNTPKSDQPPVYVGPGH